MPRIQTLSIRNRCSERAAIYVSSLTKEFMSCFAISLSKSLFSPRSFFSLFSPFLILFEYSIRLIWISKLSVSYLLHHSFTWRDGACWNVREEKKNYSAVMSVCVVKSREYLSTIMASFLWSVVIYVISCMYCDISAWQSVSTASATV